MDALQWSQLAALMAQTTNLFARPDSQQGRMASAMLQNAQSNIVAENIRKQREEQKKKEKSIFGGSVGGILGTAAGIALAPVTGGASMALAGGLGGALGSAAGSSIAGGSPDPMQMAEHGIMGGIQGYQTGRAAIPEANPPQQTLLQATMPTPAGVANQLRSSAIGPGGQPDLMNRNSSINSAASLLSNRSNNFIARPQQRQIPPLRRDEAMQQGQQQQQGPFKSFAGRFANAIESRMNPYHTRQVKGPGFIERHPDGTVIIY